MTARSERNKADLADLVLSYKEGKVTSPVMLDNDSTSVWQDDREVFGMDPHDLLEAALDLLGIPHEHV